MRTRTTITVSPPPAMIEEVERVRKAEHRTRSELVREALRTYLGAGRSYLPTVAERRAIERGRTELRRGEYLTLEELRAHVGAVGRKARRKSRRSRRCLAHLLRRAVPRRHRAPPGEDCGDEDRRGQDAGRDAAALSERARGQGRAPGHGQRLPRSAGRPVDGARLPLPRPLGCLDHPRPELPLR